MGWIDQVSGLLGRYAGANQQEDSSDTFNHFNQIAQAAPPDMLAQGIAHAFRSDQTPPFPNMLGQLFSQADPNQRAGLLNTLMGAVGPTVMQQALGGMFGGGQMTPQQAAQIPPQQIHQLAGLAEQQNPGIVDQISGFIGQNPGLFQTLGAGALTTAMAGIAQRHRGGPSSGGYGSDVLPASQDPYGDPADEERYPAGVLPASQDPYGDPGDR